MSASGGVRRAQATRPTTDLIIGFPILQNVSVNFCKNGFFISPNRRILYIHDRRAGCLRPPQNNSLSMPPNRRILYNITVGEESPPSREKIKNKQQMSASGGVR